jgi:ketosteroid isomerase-like protein
MTSTTTQAVPAEKLRSAPASYFAAVDALDVERVLTHFAEDATLTVQTAGVTFSGHAEIERMFTDFFSDWSSMVHDIVNLVVDESAGKVATEQLVSLVSGETTKMHNCNFFTLGADGRFSRVIIWMDGANPLN